MTQDEYRNLRIDDIVYRNDLRMLRRISSQISDKDAVLDSNHYLWTNDLSGEYLMGSEGLPFRECDKWIVFTGIENAPDWVKFEILFQRMERLENFVYSRLQ